MRMSFSLMVCMDASGGISFKGRLPWYISEDWKYFKRITTTCMEGMVNAVIMGSDVRDLIPSSNLPLSDRLNIVLSSSSDAQTLDIALSLAGTIPSVDSIFVIGGSYIYSSAIVHPLCERIYVTRIGRSYPECDCFFPVIPSYYKLEVYGSRGSFTDECTGEVITYRFEQYARI